MKKILFLIIPMLVFYTSCTYKKGEVPELPAAAAAGDCDSAVSYASQIAPLVMNYCNGCHTPGGTGTGDFSDYAGLKQKADDGSLKNRVVVVKDMPEAGSPTLTDAERKLIDCWIKQGAPNN
jgi:mono/diheme cytochrome c family protein